MADLNPRIDVDCPDPGLLLEVDYFKFAGPITPFDDSDEIDIPSERYDKLLQEFQCPVCLSLLEKTMIVMDCLHRFCDECITRSLRLGKKECPQCRIRVNSHRNLRPDVKFDLLIKALVPNRTDYEEKEEKIITEINRQVLQHPASSVFEEGLRRQASLRNKRVTKKMLRGPTPPPLQTELPKKSLPETRQVRSSQPPARAVQPRQKRRKLTKISSSSVPKKRKTHFKSDNTYLPKDHESTSLKAKASAVAQGSLPNPQTKHSPPEKKARQPQISFKLLPHPDEVILPSLPSPHLKMEYGPSVLVGVMVRYLAKHKFMLHQPSVLKMFSSRSDGSLKPLSSRDNLFQVLSKVEQKKENILYYALVPF